MTAFNRLCIYCGSSDDVDPGYLATAREFGALLARRGIDLVFGGGRVGLMGAAADGALAAGGRVYGVIPRKLMDLEVGHTGCTELFVVTGMHARKNLMASLADAFVALPGGWGTLEELFEVTTWTLLGYHDKPVGLLNTAGYYDDLLAFLARAEAERFVRPADRGVLQVHTEGEALLDLMAATGEP